MVKISIHTFTREAPPRRANAHLGSAHALFTKDLWYGVCIICKKIDAGNATVLPRFTLKKNLFEWRERKHWNQMQWTTATKFAIRHTLTTTSSKQQQLHQQQYSNTLHSSRQVYTNTYSYVVQAYSIIIKIDQVQVLCCETAHDVHVTKREKKVLRSNNKTQSSSSSARSTMYVYKTDFSIAQTALQSSSMIVHILTLERKKRATNTHTSCAGLDPHTPNSKGQHVLLIGFWHDTLSDGYVSIRTSRRLEKMTKKRKKHPSHGDDASTVEAGTCRVGRGRGEARPAIITPRGGPHLDLGRLGLKTCSKSDFSIAETTGSTCLYTYNIYIYIHGGLRCGGLTPALAPRMHVLPEDVWFVL